MEIATATEMVRPRKLETDKKSISDTYGKFIAEPFERGFGMTLGNALRRHLLSSINGAAVTSVRFEGVYHEFSTLPGVVEDIADIILNIKGLRFKFESSECPKSVFIKAEGAGEIKGKDIETDSSIVVMNPEHYITTLNNSGKLNLEMVVKNGKGYIPSEKNTEEGMDPQMISIDSIHSPIKKVDFEVENTRVGKSTEYEKLILEVWTDGSVHPEDALAQSAKLLKDHLQIFINFEDEVEIKQPVVDEKRERILVNLKKSVEELELSVRSYNCLKNANIRYLADLVVRTDGEMLKTQNFGRKSLNEIKAILKDMDITFGMNIDEYQEELINEGIIER